MIWGLGAVGGEGGQQSSLWLSHDKVTKKEDGRGSRKPRIELVGDEGKRERHDMMQLKVGYRTRSGEGKDSDGTGERKIGENDIFFKNKIIRNNTII